MFNHRFSNQPCDTLLTKPDVFAVFTFNGRCEPSTPGVIHTGITALPEQGAVEVWEIPGAKVTRAQHGPCHISKTDDFLCAATWANAKDCLDINQATERCYNALIAAMRETGYPHPIRFWNYIPEINRGEGDLEEYKKFCEGRLRAFNSQGYATQQFPAASGLGHSGDKAVFFVFASRQPGTHYENPSQEKAYCYPREYGKSRPSFARATAIPQPASTLFVSGTAAIIGHQTIHLGETQQQVEATLDNIRTLLAHTHRKVSSLQSLKVYLRDPTALAAVKNIVQSQFPDVATLYTRADICRANLLVEIEAHCQA